MVLPFDVITLNILCCADW